MTFATSPLDSHKPPPPDQPTRNQIHRDLDVNMLVEAGAGSGKTTSLVGRMHALIATGVPVERIAAVTFTKKAANELRERFQLKLETELRAAEPLSSAWQFCDTALRDLDRAFLGTVHSFCARILREHPLEISLDPNFAEVSDNAWGELTRSFWNRWLERCKRNGDGALTELAALGVDTRSLYDGFRCVMQYQDVEFQLTETVRPIGANCRAKVESLLARALVLLPSEEPADGWDRLMSLVRSLDYQRRMSSWDNISSLCTSLESIGKTSCELTLKRWSDTAPGKAAAKALSEEFLDLMQGDIAELLTRWYEHRYPRVMRFLGTAASEFHRERHETGQLGFEDLLMLTAKLLREYPRVRDGLGQRYRHLLVDEFQDTDPIQAEVCFLLASDSSEGSDWRTVTPRPGGIFLVGDPKQSIYRFRRADIQVYEFAKARIRECGEVLALTSNFRSVNAIGDFINRYFESVFPREATEVQALFTQMHPARGAGADVGVSEYWVRPQTRYPKAIVEADSEQVASWIASRVASGERVPGDFLILTYRRKPIADYARALAKRNIPVVTAGAELPQEAELKELLVVLHAIADPDNNIMVVAALEGLFFGCGPADLYDAHVGGVEFKITHAPDASDSIVAAALLQLHEWWKISQRHAADVLVERILDDTGVLCYAASQMLGDARAGALLRIVAALRSASMSGASGITDAMDRIELLLSEGSDDAPLRPGRADAVRVMNLHKAKGLEAPVVVLAAPVPPSVHPETVHIVRGEGDAASGGVIIAWDGKTVAQPVGWAEMAKAEGEFADAEGQRLLYVAATRAMDELLVSRCEMPKAKSAKEATPDTSAWSPLGAVLSEVGNVTAMVTTEAPGRRVVAHDSQYLSTTIAATHERTQKASVSSTAQQTVTESAKEQRESERAYDRPRDQGRGRAWGRAVHRCIEAAGLGRPTKSLRTFAAAVANDERLPVEHVAELQALITEIQQSDLWARLTKAGDAHFELPVMQCSDDSAQALLTEGILDAVALVDGEWLVVDWKTDSVDDAEWAKRQVQYGKQVAVYEQILKTLSDLPAASVIQRVKTGGMDAS
jgi:ATP-dependent helicase/nuclease subunit A